MLPADRHRTEILAVLRTDARWAVPVAELAQRLALDASTVLTALAALVESDLVEVWPTDPDGPSACLSPLGRVRVRRPLANAYDPPCRTPEPSARLNPARA